MVGQGTARLVSSSVDQGIVVIPPAFFITSELSESDLLAHPLHAPPANAMSA